MLSNKNAYSNKSSEGNFTCTTFIPMECKFWGNYLEILKI